MPDAIRIGPFPCPWPNRGQGRVGPSESGKAGWAKPAKLAREQRAIVKAAMGTCCRCGAPYRAIRLQQGAWVHGPSCRHRGTHRLRPHQLPPHGPEHPVDVLLVRIPRAGAPAKGLDWDGAIAGAKALIDEVTEQLWSRDPVTRKLLGKPDDSAPWLRWSVRQRPHRKAKPPRKPPPGWVPGPPDPPNKGTELVEIWIAPREDCDHTEKVARLLHTSTSGVWSLADCRREAGKLRCGCGRSTLPVRWRRGEL